MYYAVRLTTDKSELHTYLRGDAIWAAYAIGDLETVHFDWCTWHLAEDAAGRLAGLALLYRRLDPPVLLLVGDTVAVTTILEQTALPEQVSVSAREEHLPLLLARYDFSADRVRPMLRMAVTSKSFRPAAQRRSVAAGLTLRRLSEADVPAIEALIVHGGPFAPDAFSPAQVAEGLFIGLERVEAGRKLLVAVAGTHLVAPAWGVAALGNVYVHPAWRGRGYGALVSSAVTAHLLSRGLLVVLNVDQNNQVAINLYRQLGFVVHCPFVEGIGRIRNT